jgi:hypothetical protein
MQTIGDTPQKDGLLTAEHSDLPLDLSKLIKIS